MKMYVGLIFCLWMSWYTINKREKYGNFEAIGAFILFFLGAIAFLGQIVESFG